MSFAKFPINDFYQDFALRVRKELLGRPCCWLPIQQEWQPVMCLCRQFPVIKTFHVPWNYCDGLIYPKYVRSSNLSHFEFIRPKMFRINEFFPGNGNKSCVMIQKEIHIIKHLHSNPSLKTHSISENAPFEWRIFHNNSKVPVCRELIVPQLEFMSCHYD